MWCCTNNQQTQDWGEMDPPESKAGNLQGPNIDVERQFVTDRRRENRQKVKNQIKHIPKCAVRQKEARGEVTDNDTTTHYQIPQRSMPTKYASEERYAVHEMLSEGRRWIKRSKRALQSRDNNKWLLPWQQHVLGYMNYHIYWWFWIKIPQHFSEIEIFSRQKFVGQPCICAMSTNLQSDAAFVCEPPVKVWVALLLTDHRPNMWGHVQMFFKVVKRKMFQCPMRWMLNEIKNSELC